MRVAFNSADQGADQGALIGSLRCRREASMGGPASSSGQLIEVLRYPLR